MLSLDTAVLAKIRGWPKENVWEFIGEFINRNKPKLCPKLNFPIFGGFTTRNTQNFLSPTDSVTYADSSDSLVVPHNTTVYFTVMPTVMKIDHGKYLANNIASSKPLVQGPSEKSTSMNTEKYEKMPFHNDE